MPPKRKSSGSSAQPKAPAADTVRKPSILSNGDARTASSQPLANEQTKRAKQAADNMPSQPLALPIGPVPAVDDPKALPLLSASFSSLVALIPPKYYLIKDDDDEKFVGSGPRSRFHMNVRPGSLSKKEAAKAARIAKLDPANHLSVEKAAEARAQADASDEEEYDEDDSDNDSLPFAVDDDDESDMEDPRTGKRKRSSEDSEDEDSDEPKEMEMLSKKGQATSIEDLKSRLQDRIAALRKKRGVDEDVPESEALLAERKRRGEMRDRRRKERKEARRAEKEAKEAKAAPASAGHKKPTDSILRTQGGGRNTAPALLVAQPKKNEDEAAKKAHKAYEVDTSAADVQYGGEVDEQVQKLAETHNLPRDPKTALAMLQARKAKAERKAEKKRAKLGDNYQAPTAKDAAWEKAQAAAAGVRVRDNEAMLQQAAARKDRAKAKGKAKWDERTQAVKDAQAARQAKREENIALRQKSKNSRKPHPKDTRKAASSSSRPGAAGKATSSRGGMEGKARGKSLGKGKGGRK